MGQKPTFLLLKNASIMEILERLKALIHPNLKEYNVGLVDFYLKGKPGRFRLCIIADKDNGISIGECGDIAKRIGQIEELDNLLGMNYQLEVTSPGLDRPLESEPDFRRKIGRNLEIYIEDGQKKKIKGQLVQVSKEGVYMEDEHCQIFVQFNQIIKAVQALPW